MRIVYSEKHKLHATDEVLKEGNPFITEEIPARAEKILSAIRSAHLGTITEPSDHGLEPILAVHDADFVHHLREVYFENAAYWGKPEAVFPHAFAVRQSRRKPRGFLGQLGYYAFSSGTPILEGTWEAAYWSVQTALTAADFLLAGDRSVYALCRPPGHHAARDFYGGFCYLNNAAIAARYLGAGGARVAILDLDYHHGNGTQEIFYDDPLVMFCSLHADPDENYPYYWGGADEVGEGPGKGANRNWPLPRDTDDESYLQTLELALDAILTFSPEHLVVSAGFDILVGDPVGGFAVTNDGLRRIGCLVASLDIPTVIVQEGGYAIEHLGEYAVTFLKSFS